MNALQKLLCPLVIFCLMQSTYFPRKRIALLPMNLPDTYNIFSQMQQRYTCWPMFTPLNDHVCNSYIPQNEREDWLSFLSSLFERFALKVCVFVSLFSLYDLTRWCVWLTECVREWVGEWVSEWMCVMCVYVCVCADSMVLFVLYLAVAAHFLQLLLVWGHFLHFLFQAHVCVCVNECRILLKSLHMFATT